MFDTIGPVILNYLKQSLYVFPVLIIALTLHEYAHAWTAYKLGDDTAKLRGRLTINPLKHLDIVGTLMFLVARIGWAKPVPVNSMNFKNPKQDMVKVGLAGPLMNIIIAFITAFPLQALILFYSDKEVGDFTIIIFTFLSMLFSVNLYLAVFNLIPIPPLDGSKIFYGILPENFYFKAMQYERYLFLILLLVVVFAPKALSWVLNTLTYPLKEAFFGIAKVVVGIFI